MRKLFQAIYCKASQQSSYTCWQFTLLSSLSHEESEGWGKFLSDFKASSIASSIVSWWMHALDQLSFRVNSQIITALPSTFSFGSTPAVPKATLISGANDGTIFRFTQTHFALPGLDSDRTTRPPRV
jgi:hypothetical protein